MPPVGSQLPGRERGDTVISNEPLARRTTSWLVKPWRATELRTSAPSRS
jgi:hypothetical protein